ncbi:D-beta-hydroxybutyrate dehydrogenase, mitochondrial-like [Macrobrachium rosenbergii]|uniref:D-beta-hydroxybutyrate dehydrogenase, mitochondrial-like n=1 Tax=Macrobrachium rosenbergii TaxID=79674 RepID=UPI0034D659FF
MLNLDKTARILSCGAASLAVSLPLHFAGLANILLFFPGAWLLTTSVYVLVANLRVPASGKAVLVTGCDTGFGHGLAVHLHQLGFRVFAGCLEANTAGEGAERLRRLFTERMHVLQLDITKEEQVNAALHEVKMILPASEVLWGVVNNAGLSTFGAVEWVPMTTYRKLAEVNIFGHISVTKVFLPLVRKSKGRIVNVTSVEGRMAGPLVSTYDLTKFAMEGFSDSLRHEMRRFGVHVSLVEPGNFTAGTSLNTDERVVKFAEEMWASMDAEVKLAYGKQYFNDVIASRMIVNRSGETDLSPAIEAMADALTQRFPQARYSPMGLDLFVRMFVAEHLPEWVSDHLLVG